MPALRPFARLKNNQPDPITLPYPLAGVLRGGEDVLTRYNLGRLLFLLNGDGAEDRVRQLQTSDGPRAATEGDFSRHSPGRDYFRGEVRTTSTTTTDLLFPQAGGTFPGLRADQFQPGQYDCDITLKAIQEVSGTVKAAVYRRRFNFSILQDGTAANGNAAGTLGTDFETDAGLNIGLATSATYPLIVQAVGLAGVNLRWAADVFITSVNWAG